MRKLVLIEPEIPENTGSIARLAANFYFELRIVNPQFNLAEARKTAKNAQNKLRDARIYEKVEEAVKDLDYIVGTKPGRGQKLHVFQPRENTSLMIGRESSGLSNKELDLCDAVVEIQTSEMSSINQSHAAGIIMAKFNQTSSKGLEKGMKQKIKSLVPTNTAEAIIKSSPSEAEAGKIIQELRSITEK